MSSSDSVNLSFFLKIWHVANTSLELGPNPVPDTALSVLLTYLMLTTALSSKNHHFNHLTHEIADPNNVRDGNQERTCPRTPS